MKKLLLMASVMCLSLCSMAQTDSAAAPKQNGHKEHKKGMQTANAAAWACPKCFAITKEGGQCTMDQTDKVQLGTYYCEHCMKTTGTKPGKCATCAAPAVQMTRKLCAKHQHHTEKKAA
jgi:hypothetical protein